MEVQLGRTGPVRRRNHEEGGSKTRRRRRRRREEEEAGRERRWSWKRRALSAARRAGRRKNLATSTLLAKDPKGTIASTSPLLVWRRFVRWFVRSSYGRYCTRKSMAFVA
jgi:ribosome assembly protein YihI (activator of Der GTPase)